MRAWLRSVGANRILMLDDEILAKWEDFIESKAITEDASDVIAREFTNAFAEEAKVERALTSLLNRRGTILGDDDWNRLPEYTRMRRMLRARYAYYYRGLEAFNIRLYARGEANDVVTFSKRRLELLRPRLEEIKRKRDDMDLMDIRRLLDEIAVEEGVGV